MARGGYFACGAHQVAFGEKLARAHAQLAAYHFLVELVVAVDHHFVHAGLRTLDHTHLQGDRVALYFLLDRDKLEEQVAVVEVEVRHGVVILGGALVEHLLIVDIAWIHAEIRVEHVGRIDRIAHPGYVADVILASFVDTHEHVDLAVIVFRHGIVCDARVAVSQFVVFLYQTVQVILKVALHKFLLAEYFQDVAVLVGFLEGAFHFFVRQHLISLHVDPVDLDAVVAVHRHVEYGIVLLRKIGLLCDLYACVLETLLGVILFDDFFRLGYDIGCELLSRHHSKAFVQILFLAAFHSLEAHLRHSGLLLQRYFKPHLVAGDLVDVDLDFGVETLSPESAHRVGYCRSRDVHAVPD